jgi:hypothetical protein
MGLPPSRLCRNSRPPFESLRARPEFIEGQSSPSPINYFDQKNNPKPRYLSGVLLTYVHFVVSLEAMTNNIASNWLYLFLGLKGLCFNIVGAYR